MDDLEEGYDGYDYDGFDYDECNLEEGYDGLPDPVKKPSLRDLLDNVTEILDKAVKKYKAPLRLVIDSRGPRFAHIAYGSEYRTLSIDDIEQMSK